MIKKLTLFLACLFLSIGIANAQMTVTGTVTDEADGYPITGATVQVVGSQVGTATDIDGKFTLNVPSGKNMIRVSYIGMITQEVAVSPNMNIVLKSSETTLDEVVVTAMGIKREAKALGVSATPIKGDVIAQARTNDIMSSLAGKVAGVQIGETSSDPGSSKSVIIRGVSSLSGSNQPLYVVDGVPLNNSASYSSDGLNSGYDFGNGASAVNPNDVESMTILKGAAATALYGSRAGAGVILITTKKGTKQKKGVGIEYNGGLQWETLLRLPQMQNDFGMGWYGDHTEIENGSWGPRFDGSEQLWGWTYNYSQGLKSYLPIKSNMQDFFSTGFRYSNSISFNGATDKSTYFVSLSQINDDGIIPRSSDTYTKYTVSGRGSHREGPVTFSTSLNYAFQRNHFVTTGQKTGSMYNSIMQTPRDIAIVEMKDLDNPFSSPGYYYTPYGVTNPYYIIENYQNEYEQERFYGNLQLDYDFLKYFKATYRFGLDTNTGHHNFGSPNMASLFKDTPNYEDALKELTGEVSQSMTRRREIDQNFMITYDQQVLEDLHINAQLGFNGNERTYKYLGSTVTNLTIPMWYNLSNSAEIPSVSESQWKRRYMAVFGSAEFAYKNMLYLTLQGRNDWSSTLPKSNRSYFYPGVSLSFLFSELLKAIRFGSRLILVGDTDQLPAVGPGNVLGDLIDSGLVPVVSLTEIFRQARQSLIIMNAHRIIAGEMPELSRTDNDFFFMRRPSPAHAVQTVLELYASRLPKAYGYSPMTDIQVLCPSRKGECGTISLNRRLQDAINPPGDDKREYRSGGRLFREGDKVMQVRNNYDIPWEKGDESGAGLFNGDMGILLRIDAKAGVMTVDFDDGKLVTYPLTDVSDLETAYAVTVHKSQGSEYDAVILPLTDVHRNLSYRNLLYTAVTRAKKQISLVGDEDCVSRMVANDRQNRRYTLLKTMLKR